MFSNSENENYNKFLQSVKSKYSLFNAYYANYMHSVNRNKAEYKFFSDDGTKSFATIKHRLNKLVLIKNLSYIKDFVYFCSSKQYANLCNMLTVEKGLLKGLNINDCDLEGFQYVIRDCPFVVRDLGLFLKQLSEQYNILINKGDKRERGHIHEMSSFLGCLDAAYRNYINEVFDKLKKELDIVMIFH